MWSLVAILALNLLLLILVTQALQHKTENTKDAVSSLGMRGEEVRRVQRALREQGYFTGEEDGVFSLALRKAVRQYQEKNGLEPTGEADAATLRLLEISQSAAANTDEELLAHLIMHMAGGKNYQQQVCVGAVALNRMNHPAYPNTLAGVLLYDSTGAGLAAALLQAVPDTNAKKAARDCLNGCDPTGGSLVYPQ